MCSHQEDFYNKIVTILLQMLESDIIVSDEARKIYPAIIKIQMNEKLIENEKVTSLLQSCSANVIRELLRYFFEKSQPGFYNETVKFLLKLLDGSEKSFDEMRKVYSSIIKGQLDKHLNENEKMIMLLQCCLENTLQEILLHILKKYQDVESPTTSKFS